nr:MAG TPA: hypothetical protein [Caudoviricetes sp.]
MILYHIVSIILTYCIFLSVQNPYRYTTSILQSVVNTDISTCFKA